MKTKIGIDFDKVFVAYPPIVPGSLIEYLYKKKNHDLSYRFPGKIEQKIRMLSHAQMLRRPIKTNVQALKEMFDLGKFEIYLISSRFSFLRKITENWDKNHGLSKYFKHMYFNFNDEQPHLFKNRIIKLEQIKKFIDDDLDLLRYLSKLNPKVEFYWVSGKNTAKNLPDNITRIQDLNEFKLKYV